MRTAGRDRTARWLLGGFLALSAVHLAGQLAGGGLLAQLTKPALMPVLAAWSAARGGPRSLVVALLFGCGGDTLLMLGGNGPFLAGMGCFAAGHVVYITAFARRGGLAAGRRTRAAAVLYGLGWATSLVTLGPSLGALRWPVAGYSLLLSTMALSAAGLSVHTCAGGALFLLSDSLIAAGLAHWPQLPRPEFWIMLTYLGGQYLLATGLVAARDVVPRGGNAPPRAHVEARVPPVQR
ncbi:lysoplasmalogenase [Streptantibioticus ferralitis]|uniref:Lysoplasmalogenase n=1 Tax=Streptantibioticus ferralitis TaxID=236510 RepID=A0ABT5YZD2_9ACTN|nr:lysoplasmalogenase [Streptantibioticus ferralitis]MDF2256873.1 lysoplasmalogenase [Streptantibioticus ferralitis]